MPHTQTLLKNPAIRNKNQPVFKTEYDFTEGRLYDDPPKEPLTLIEKILIPIVLLTSTWIAFKAVGFIGGSVLGFLGGLF